MTHHELSVKFFCKDCGRKLEADVEMASGYVEFKVEPCEHCMDDKFEEGYQNGLPAEE